VDVVDRDGSAVRAQGRDRNIAQPDGFFDQGAGAVVLTQQVAGFVVGVEDGAIDATADLNPLAEGVVDRSFGGRRPVPNGIRVFGKLKPSRRNVCKFSLLFEWLVLL